MLTYHQDIQAQCEKNRLQALVVYKDQHAILTHALSRLHFLTEKYMIRYMVGIGSNRNSELVLSTLYKGLNNMQAIMDLTISGHIGAARIVMRNVFEYLVIGKYLQLFSDEGAVEKWDNIEYINIDRRIFQRTIYPDNQNKGAFLRWWKLLCQYSHATRTSGQISFLFEEIKSEIHVNFSFMFVLCSMLHHFMSNFLANDYFRNYIDSLPKHDTKEAPNQSLNQCTQELKTLIKTIKSLLSKECKQILSYYIAAWRLAPERSKREPFQNNSTSMRISETGNLPLSDSLPTNKEALLKYMRSFIGLYSEPQEGLKEGYRKSVIKYLKRMQTLITEHTFFELPNNAYFYTLEILNDRIQLLLGRRQWSPLEDTKDDELSWLQKMVLLEVKSEYLNAEQYATIYGVSHSTVMQWIHRARMHGIRQLENNWMIPELQPRPTYGIYHVEYTWNAFPAHLLDKHPMLKNSRGLFIYKQKGDPNYILTIDSQPPQEPSILNDVQRIRLEMELIGSVGVEANDALVTLVPNS